MVVRREFSRGAQRIDVSATEPSVKELRKEWQTGVAS
jgi:hypothetical protein